MHTSTVIIIAVAMCGMIYAFIRLAKSIGIECVFCGGRSLKMDQLPREEYAKLRAYFWNVEKRVPVADNVYVCCECQKVNDDCITHYTPAGMTIVCKACGHTTNLDRRMTCNHCGAQFEWTIFKECGYYYFLLPKNNNKEANRHPGPGEDYSSHHANGLSLALRDLRLKHNKRKMK